MAAITVAMRTEISQLYVSLFGRAPDSDGLGFWVSSYAGGNTIAKIAQSMYETTPARTYYPLYATPSEVVTTFYSNVLGRAPDAEGLAFWVNEFKNAATPGTFFAKLVSNVVNYSGTDADGLSSQSLFNNKVTVAQFYGENGGTIAGATSALSGVTAVASTVDTAKAAILNPAAAVVAGQTFTLTTSVDTVSGGAGNDTITALQATTATFTIGDNIIGGAGTDTLNILNTTATASAVVSIDGVENINVRMLQADTQGFDATDWSGVAVLSNASSIADSTLSVSGLTIATTINVNDESNVSIDFADIATGAETATVILNSVGSGTTSTVTVATAGTAGVTLDATGADTLAAANLTVNGTNFLRLEGGDGLRTVTLTGTGNVHLTTDDLITSLDASALTGTNRFTLSGRSDVSVVGGAGKDTFAFGTSLNASDVIDGGADTTDALTATLGNSVVRLNATNLETATITLAEAAGGGMDFSAGQSVTTLTVAATAGASATITNFAGGTVNISDTDVTDLAVDTISGATLSLVVGSGTGGVVDISTAAITDAITVNVSTIGSGTQVINALTLDSDAKTLGISSVGSANLTVATGYASALTSLTITAAGSAAISLTSADLLIAGTALATVNLAARDSNAADLTINGDMFSAGSAVSISRTINIDASSGADINISSIQMGTSIMASGTAASGTLAGAGLVVNASAGNGSDITWSAADGIDGLSATYNLNAAQSGDIALIGIDGDIENASATAESSIKINVDVAQDATVVLGAVSGSGQTITIDALEIGASGLFAVSGGILATAGDISLGAITVGASGKFTAGALAASGITIGAVVVGSSGGYTIGAATGAVKSLSVSLNQAATATFGAIHGSMAGVTVTAVSGGSATFGAISGGATKIGAIDLNIGTGNVDFSTISGSAMDTVSIAIAGEGSADFGNITMSGGTVGDITVTVGASGSADFGDIAADRIGSIKVSGAGWIDLSISTATNVGGIDLRGQLTAGTAVFDLSGVVNGVVVDGGQGTTTITSGKGNDEFYLKTGLGAESLIYNSTAQGTDTIYRFEAGTADDTIYIAATAFDLTDGAGEVIVMAGGNGIANATAAVF